MVNLPHDAPSPRLCTLQKDSLTQEYGYNLHAEKGRGQFVGAVDSGSVADRAGLRTGDKIFAVNGHVIKTDGHKKVVDRIKQDPMCCELLVIDERGAEWYKEHNIDITPSLPNVIRICEDDHRTQSANSSPPPNTWYAPQNNNNVETKVAPVFVAPPPPAAAETMKPRPRLCHLKKVTATDEFGFNLHAEKNRGHFIGTVDGNGIGDKAGLRMGQRIVGVNGELVYPGTPHKEVVALIKRSPLSTMLLVASEEVDKWYKEHSEEYSFEHVEEGGVPVIAPASQISPHSIQVNFEDSFRGYDVVGYRTTDRNPPGYRTSTPPPPPLPVHAPPAFCPSQLPPPVPHQVDEPAEEVIARKMTLDVINSIYEPEPAARKPTAPSEPPVPVTRYETTVVVANDLPPANADDILAQVFSGVAIAPVGVVAEPVHHSRYDQVPDELDDLHYDHGDMHHDHDDMHHDHEDMHHDHHHGDMHDHDEHHDAYAHHEEEEEEEHHAVLPPIPQPDYYPPEPVVAPITKLDHHHDVHQTHSSQQISPISQNSSGYGNSDSSIHNGDAFSIYNLSAKEARERLRGNKRNQRYQFDMSLEDKHRLVSNM